MLNIVRLVQYVFYILCSRICVLTFAKRSVHCTSDAREYPLHISNVGFMYFPPCGCDNCYLVVLCHNFLAE